VITEVSTRGALAPACKASGVITTAATGTLLTPDGLTDDSRASPCTGELRQDCSAKPVKQGSPMTDSAETDEARNVLLEELKWVHALIRADLRVCRGLASDMANGTPSSEIRSQIQALQTRGPLFQLRTNCLRHCRFVHAHHGHEDIGLFPAVRKAAPRLGGIVDRLEDDHRRVSGLLDDVEAAAYQLDSPADEVARQRLADALKELSEHLLEHLSFEEQVLAPVLLTWDRWPFFD